MRLLGAGFLWISLTCVGVVYARKLKNRIILLDNTRYLIRQIKIETEYLRLPAGDIIIKLSKSPQLKEIDFLFRCSELLREGEDFPDAWKISLDETSLNYMIAEKEKLLHLGGNFGTSDIKNQLSMLEAYENYFEEFFSQAKRNYDRQAKTSSLLGGLLGCMLFIMLI